MGNPHKGEVEFTVGKKVYTLHFSINAMCELEDALGGNVVELASIMGDAGKLSMKTMRAVFWAGLRDHHESMTVTQAGSLISELGMGPAMELMAKAFTLAFPAVEGNGPLPVGAPAKVDLSTGKAH